LEQTLTIAYMLVAMAWKQLHHKHLHETFYENHYQP